LADFQGSQGLELFFVPFAKEQWQALHQQLEGKSLASFIEAGFYSVSRHSRGDSFGLKLGSTPLPNGERSHLMSRLELLLIDDQVSNNQYVTTLSAHATGGPGARLYGVRTPDSGERQGIWYAKEDKQPAVLLATSTAEPQFSPSGHFSGFAGTGGEAQAEPSFSLRLSDDAWNQLMNMPVNDALQWRYELNHPGGRQTLFSHMVKIARLQLQRPDNINCRADSLDGVSGQRCMIRTVNWQGAPASASDIRFVLRSRVTSPTLRYRVGQQWHPSGDSIPVSEFSDSQGIELFFVPEDLPAAGGKRHAVADRAALASLIQMRFFSASRLGMGDRFALKASDVVMEPAAGQKTTRENAQVRADEKLFIRTITVGPIDTGGNRFGVGVEFNREFEWLDTPAKKISDIGFMRDVIVLQLGEDKNCLNELVDPTKNIQLGIGTTSLFGKLNENYPVQWFTPGPASPMKVKNIVFYFYKKPKLSSLGEIRCVLAPYIIDGTDN
ncbi:MAG: hypothetical protein ACRC5A_12685, partial [Enterobacteriaceae bacterium]